jgi:hypothetical protein
MQKSPKKNGFLSSIEPMKSPHSKNMLGSQTLQLKHPVSTKHQTTKHMKKRSESKTKMNNKQAGKMRRTFLESQE